MKQHRSWTFTLKIKDDTLQHVRSYLASDQIRFAMIGSVVGESGDAYLQGYVSFLAGVRLATLQHAIPLACWSVANLPDHQTVTSIVNNSNIEMFGKKTCSQHDQQFVIEHLGTQLQQEKQARELAEAKLTCLEQQIQVLKRKNYLISKDKETESREEEGKCLFSQLCNHQTFHNNHPFMSQYFIVVEEKEKSTKCDHRCLLNAKRILVVPRVARLGLVTMGAGTAAETNHVPAYLYVANNLHCKLHFSCSKEMLEQLKHLCSDATFVLCQEDTPIRFQDPLNYIIDSVCSLDFHLLRENFHPNDTSFFQKIHRIMTVDFFPEIKSLLLKSVKVQEPNKRKTVAINIGYSTTDCNRYIDNRLTIFDNIKPFLSGLKLSEKARKLLGQIAVLGFKKAVEKGFLQNETFPTNSDSAIRHQLRQEFAKYLYIPECDIPFFIAEGIAIVLNPSLGPHKDDLNDPNFDTTLTITSMVSQSTDSVEEDKKLMQLVGKTFPFTVIFYSRRVCGSYHLLRSELDCFSKVGGFQAYLVQCILDVHSPNNYYARLFDSNEYYSHLLRQSGAVTMPRYYDPLSRYSIALDMIFRHAVLSEQKRRHVTVENLLVILLNLVKDSKYSDICVNIDQFDFSKMHNTNPGNIKRLFRLAKEAERGQKSDIDARWSLFHEKLLDSPFHLKVIEATELIHLMSLMGIIPLEFYMWSSIQFLPNIVQEKEWLNIINFVKMKFNGIASVDTLKTIAIDYINQVVKPKSKYNNCEEVFGNIRTWAISKTGICQNIFRLKKQTSNLVALCIRAPIIDHKDSKKSKSIQLTNWDVKNTSICWKHPIHGNGLLVLGSKMHVDPQLRKYFS